jgi:hypothetical protein
VRGYAGVPARWIEVSTGSGSHRVSQAATDVSRRGFHPVRGEMFIETRGLMTLSSFRSEMLARSRIDIALLTELTEIVRDFGSINISLLTE